MFLAGVDLAWQTARNPSAIAHGYLDKGVLHLSGIDPAVLGIEAVIDRLNAIADLRAVAIDAPLIMENATGHRAAEKQISSMYGGRGASCHACNTTLYPQAASVYLSRHLRQRGFAHLAGERWQFECYPHAALIEIFGLSRRLPYKKGSVAERRLGQARLANLLRQLVGSEKLSLKIPASAAPFFDADRIQSLAGQALKSNEDALDSVVCLYVAGLNAAGCNGRVFGDIDTGYVWIPYDICI